MEIRALAEADERSQFRSGDADLDRFFQRFAAQKLLRFVLWLARRMADDYGCVGIVVDAKADAVEFYAKYGFIPVEAVHGHSEARPRPTPMFLAMRAVKKASGAL